MTTLQILEQTFPYYKIIINPSVWVGIPLLIMLVTVLFGFIIKDREFGIRVSMFLGCANFALALSALTISAPSRVGNSSEVLASLEVSANALDAFLANKATLTINANSSTAQITYHPVTITEIQFGKAVTVDTTPLPVTFKKTKLAKIEAKFKELKPEFALALNKVK